MTKPLHSFTKTKSFSCFCGVPCVSCVDSRSSLRGLFLKTFSLSRIPLSGFERHSSTLVLESDCCDLLGTFHCNGIRKIEPMILLRIVDSLGIFWLVHAFRWHLEKLTGCMWKSYSRPHDLFRVSKSFKGLSSSRPDWTYRPVLDTTCNSLLQFVVGLVDSKSLICLADDSTGLTGQCWIQLNCKPACYQSCSAIQLLGETIETKKEVGRFRSNQGTRELLLSGMMITRL